MVRTLVRSLAALAVAAALLAAGLLALVLETEPQVTGVAPADAAAAARARDLLLDLQAVAAEGAAGRGWQVSEEVLNGALAAGARVLPGLAARATVGGRDVAVAASMPVPGTVLWVNVAGAVAARGSGLRIDEARVGRLSLPPGVVLAALRLGLDRVLGDGLGAAALDAVARVRTDPPVLTVAFELAEAERLVISERIRDAISAGASAGDRRRVEAHLRDIDAARQQGELPAQGSVLPYLRFAVERAHLAARGRDDAAAEMRAALFALTLYCGDARFGQIIGVELPRHMRGRRNGCAGTDLAGRRDLRQHFVVSAGVKAASSASAALGIGELKELLDSGPDGTGFSFDDMAANLAGARFAAEALGRGSAGWPELAARMGKEIDLMPRIDDLPAGLSEPAFRARFGDVDSPAYRALLAEIEARVEALPLYRTAIN